MIVTDRTNNPLLKEIETRAIAAIREKRSKLPPNPSSVSVSEKIWANELTLEIGELMVTDVRANITANIRGCSVCYAIVGDITTNHTSGNKCTKLPLTAQTTGWMAFKDKLKFPSSIVCFNCLLPTVRASLAWFGCCD